MTLLSLYVTAFGGVRELDYRFTPGINEILLPNGTGKSTLAAFIKAMLFGLSKSGAEPPENEFLLYEPWQGGRFGGFLSFLHEGRAYRITRFYERVGNTKTPRLVEYSVTDEETGLPTERFGDEPGRVILGVDGESFLRTAYLSSRGISAKKTADISAKLGGVEGQEDDMAAVERALSLLRRRRTEIRTLTNRKMGQKQLDIAERELLRVRTEIAEARAALTARQEEQESARLLTERLAACEAALQALQAKKAEEDRRRGAEAEAERRRTELTARLAASTERAERLGKHFADGAPSAELLATLETDAAEHRARKAEAENAPKEAAPPPSDTEITAARTAVRYRAEKREQLRRLTEAPPQSAERKGHLQTLLLPLLLLFIGGGIALLFLLPILGALLLLLGVTAAAVLLLFRRRAAVAAQEHALWREGCHTAEEEASDAARRAAEHLCALALPDDAEEADLDALHEHAVAARLAADVAKRNRERLHELDTALTAALAPYAILPEATDHTLRVRALRSALSEWQAATRAVMDDRAELARIAPPISCDPPAEAGLDTAIEGAKEEANVARAALAAATERERQFGEISDALTPLLDEEERLLNEISMLDTRVRMLDTTAELLLAARASYEERYLGGIRAHLATYTDRLLDGRLGKPQVDLSLGLSFLSDGAAHDALYFSTGLSAIIDVCLRLALLDALYPETPPPLLLDDPFLALDGENMETVRALLKELGTDRQILYLTCHPSRSLSV